MEQPLRRNELDPNQPFEGDAGAIANHKEVPHLAGHIVLGEAPHGGEIVLNGQPTQEQRGQAGPAFRPVAVPRGVVAPPPSEMAPQQATAEEAQVPQPSRVEHSAWHTINIDAQGQVMQQEYGQAFQQEQLAETGQTQQARMNPAAIAMQQQLPTITTLPVSASGQPVEPIRTSKVPVNPLYATAAQKQHAPDQAVPPTSVPTVPTDPYPTSPPQTVAQLQPQPIVSQPPTPVPQASPEHQQMSTSPMGGVPQPGYPQPMQPAMQLQDAINPSFAQPALPPVVQEPMLPSGQPTRVDPQHLLPMAKHHVRKILSSPWLWLAIGVLMILYFAPSLFGA